MKQQTMKKIVRACLNFIFMFFYRASTPLSVTKKRKSHPEQRRRIDMQSFTSIFKQAFNILFFISLTFPLFGQQYKAQLKPIGKTDIQTIRLSQEVRSIIGYQTDFIRIKNDAHTEISYVVKEVPSEEVFFVIDTTMKKTILPDSCTQVTVENKGKTLQDKLYLQIANTLVRKNYKIEGSYNLEDWYSLVDDGQLKGTYKEKHHAFEKKIDYPLNDYRYIRITFDDRESAPFNILTAGHYQRYTYGKSWQKVPGVSYQVYHDKANKKSVVRVHFDKRQAIDRIQLHIDSLMPFRRSATILKTVSFKEKKRVQSATKQEITHFTLENAVADLLLPATFVDSLDIQIHNLDSEPLQIDSISFYQYPIDLVAYLGADRTYTLFIDTTAQAPHYDYTDDMNFKAKRESSVIELEALQMLDSVTKEKEKPYGKIVLWVSIIVGVLVVFYFGSSLLRDMKKE